MRLEFFSELAMMIQGASGGLKTFLFSCMIIIVPVFAFAFLMREMIGRRAAEGSTSEARESGSENFDTLAISMFPSSVFRNNKFISGVEKHDHLRKRTDIVSLVILELL